MEDRGEARNLGISCIIDLNLDISADLIRDTVPGITRRSLSNSRINIILNCGIGSTINRVFNINQTDCGSGSAPFDRVIVGENN